MRHIKLNELDKVEPQRILLVLAPKNDRTIEEFLVYAESVRVETLVIQGLSDLDRMDVSICTDQDGISSVSLIVGDNRKKINGVLNRMMINSSDEEHNDPFLEAEIVASWWSILGSFNGQVINRPSRCGFFPATDLMSFLESGCRIKLPREIAYSERPLSSTIDRTINVHRLRDNRYVGRAETTLALDRHEVYSFVSFDPSKTIHILLAGHRVFDLSNLSGTITPNLGSKIMPLVNELKKRSATFSLVVIEHTEPKLEPILLHVTPFPSIFQYSHVKEKVHHAILEYLLT